MVHVRGAGASGAASVLYEYFLEEMPINKKSACPGVIIVSDVKFGIKSFISEAGKHAHWDHEARVKILVI